MTFLTHAVRRPAALAATITLLAACDAVTAGSSGNPIGVGGLTARTSGAGYTTSPAIAFYRVTSATFVTTVGVQDTCVAASFSETTSSGTSNAASISGGSWVVVKLGNRTDTLRRTAGSTDMSYHPESATGIAYTPGDSMTFIISGDANGFPASTFSGKTAEAFTLNPVTVPAAGSPIQATWSVPDAANSAMAMSFRFAAGGGTTLNRQISCTFVDDGAATVPASLAGDWIAATTRSVVAQRNRTIYEQVSVPLSYFNIVSTYTVPTPVSP
jgi:hypothetical protein